MSANRIGSDIFLSPDESQNSVSLTISTDAVNLFFRNYEDSPTVTSFRLKRKLPFFALFVQR